MSGSFPTANYLSGMKSAADLSASTNRYIAVRKNSVNDEIAAAGANERDFIGFLQNTPAAGKQAEIATFCGGSKAIAAGTIAAGAFLKTDASGHLLQIGTYENAFAVAVALESAVDNDVFTVFTLPSGTRVSGGSSNGSPVFARITATLAQINAGTVILPAITGRKLYLHSFVAMPNGSFATGTAIVLEDSTTGTDFISLAQAQLTDNAILMPAVSGVTLGAAMGDGGASGEGLKITKTGSDFATATDLALNLIFSYV